jgi:hypothetical protein
MPRRLQMCEDSLKNINNFYVIFISDGTHIWTFVTDPLNSLTKWIAYLQLDPTKPNF